MPTEQLQATTSPLPPQERPPQPAASRPSAAGDGLLRFAAVGDLHCTKDSTGRLRPFFQQAAEAADVLLLCGDLTDYGTTEEAKVLAGELAQVAMARPVVAVLGNHDFETGQPEVVSQILKDAGVRMLDGEAVELMGVGIAGAKGFAGGFGRGALGPWGEQAIKAFVNEALHEALKLESALAKLRTPDKIALLHYAPIAATVQGEPLEIFPFLGTTRLEEPLIRYPVSAVFHGHAHRGTPEGKTVNGTPVFNVAMPLLRHHYPQRPPFRLLELPRPAAGAEAEVESRQ
ncbi:metallophosphoesterase [Azohydromonas sp. G-1-1-14]|uniref:Metallophosphoesterase n=2 Tax=Azohydromonas caseinilytica TaxID=2728836 RepID=A0A848FDW8_9BURK|nr:metallophosphoesterase [Azohydromonas caseinilytica]